MARPQRAYTAPGAAAPLRAPRAAVDALRDEARAHRLALQRIANGDLAALRGILDDAEAQLRRGMARWMTTHTADGELRWTAQHYRNAITEIDNLRGMIGFRTASTLVGHVPPVVTMAIKAVQRQIDDLLARPTVRRELARLGEVFAGSIHSLAVHPAAVMASGRAYLVPRFRTSAARYAGNIATDLRKFIATDILTGAPVRDTVARLVAHGGPRGMVSLRGVLGEPGAVAEHIAEGLFARYPQWADRLVRTEYSAAFGYASNDAMLNFADQLGNRGAATKVWITAPNCCPTICVFLDGMVVTVDGSFESTVGPLKANPAHPYCRCTIGLNEVDWGRVDFAHLAAKEAPLD